MNEKRSMYIAVMVADGYGHDGIDAARKQARELAHKNPGKEVIVFRAVESAECRAEPLVLKNYSR